MNVPASLDAPELSREERDAVGELLQVWRDKWQRNALRRRYYDQKGALKDLGISIPPPLREVSEVCGWPSKAVDLLAERSVFDGFHFSDGQDRGLARVARENRLRLLYSQAVTEELVHSVSFLTVSKGAGGEPDVVISAYSAMTAAAVWDDRRKRIRHGIAVVDVERPEPGAEPEPVWVNLYTDEAVVEIRREGGSWRAERHPHLMGRPTMEPMAYRARLDRPFGKSRITRSVMAIADNATREALRTEVASEFFTTPQRYVLGADEDTFDGGKWEAYIGNILALTKDGDGDVPSVGQFAAMSMQPHIDYKRDLAAQFSGETNIPVSELGVIHDNPASAEAIYAEQEPLIIEAEKLNEANGAALEEIARMALAMMGGKALSGLDEAEASVRARFRNPARPSVVSQSDAIVKLSSAIPGLAESDVALEEVGFDEDQVARIKADRDRAQAQQMIQQAMQRQSPEGRSATMYEMKSIIQSYRAGSISLANAITLFSAVGVDEARARRILGDAEDVEEAIGDGGQGGAQGGAGGSGVAAGQA